LKAEEGGYVVTSPLDNARDALAALAASRRKLIKKLAGVKACIGGRLKGTSARKAAFLINTEIAMTSG